MNQPPPPIPGQPQGFAQVPPLPYQPKKGGAGKWIAWGCGGCLTLLIIAGVIVFMFFKNIMEKVEKSPLYASSLAAVRKSPEAVEALGEPIEPDGMLGLRVAVNNGVQTTEFTIPVKGPKGKGSLSVLTTMDVDKANPNLENVQVVLTIAGTKEKIEITPPLTPASGGSVTPKKSPLPSEKHKSAEPAAATPEEPAAKEPPPEEPGAEASTEEEEP